MNPQEMLKLADSYGIVTTFFAFLLIVTGNVVASWLTQTFFPMRLKKDTWKWEKEKWAIEQFIESLSRVEFVGKHLIRSEIDQQVSLSRLSFNETEEEIVKIITDLHRDGYRIRSYLSRHNQEVFDDYLKQSSAAFDASKASYGEWMPDDYGAEEAHALSFVDAQSNIARMSIGKVKTS